MPESSPKLYYIKKEEMDDISLEIKGGQSRAEHLVRDFYIGDAHFSRSILVYLMELVVTSEGFLVFLEETARRPPAVEKEGGLVYQITEQNLRLMANFSVMIKNIREDLRELGLAIDLQ